MTVKTIAKGAVPVAAGVLVAGLVLRYAGTLPVIDDARKGLMGDTSANFNWFGFAR